LRRTERGAADRYGVARALRHAAARRDPRDRPAHRGEAAGLATLLVSASSRTGESISSSPAGIHVAVGNSQGAGFALNTGTLTASNGRSAVWSGARSSAGKKVPSCHFVLTGDASVDGNVQ
jgi:hypothetical protein